MAHFSSQDISAQSNTNTNIQPDSDSWLIKASLRVFGPCAALDRPFPDVTDGLAERIRRVSASIQHAEQHTNLIQARKLIEADGIYNKSVKTAISSLQFRDPKEFNLIQSELRRIPHTLEEFKERLALEFKWCAGVAGPRFFHFRNNTAWLYERALEKSGVTIPLQPAISHHP